MSSDRSRQWVKKLEGSGTKITTHHLLRYVFAAECVSGRILDAACGCGYGSEILSHVGETVGVDGDKEAIDWARKYFPNASYICGRIEDAPWSGLFDSIVSIETLEHLKDPRPALDAFRDACVGGLIASVPNEEVHPFKAETYIHDEWPHYRHYTPVQFQELLAGAGFTVRAKCCQKSKYEPEVAEGTDGMFLIYVCT